MTTSETRVRELAGRWVTSGCPDPEDFGGLTPDEAMRVAILAGYTANDHLHTGIREGCRRAAELYGTAE